MYKRGTSQGINTPVDGGQLRSSESKYKGQCMPDLFHITRFEIIMISNTIEMEGHESKPTRDGG